MFYSLLEAKEYTVAQAAGRNGRKEGRVEGGNVEIPVTVYPGVFPNEYQITIHTAGREISANVSSEFVKSTEQVTEKGAKGYLTVAIVDRIGDQVMISIPGEVQGAPSRVRLPEKEFQVA